MSASATTLRRIGQSSYVGMLLAKASPPGWAKSTLLLRFAEENGINTVFVLTDAACDKFASCEVWRIYAMEVPGKCVKTVDSGRKDGVPNIQEVRMQFPCQISLSKVAWPIPLRYDCMNWSSLNQLEVDTFIDLIGRVIEKPVVDLNDGLAKMRVDLCSGEMRQVVTFLGEHAGIQISVGDVVALSGIRIKEWRSERTLQTVFLTVVEVNPVPRLGLPSVAEINVDQPKTKALRMTPRSLVSVLEVQNLSHLMLQRAEDGGDITPQDVFLLGSFHKFNDDFFVADPPIVGDSPKEKICWNTRFTDVSGSLDVKVWDRACFELFGVAASKLREMWESGVEDEDARVEVLEKLNRHLDKMWRASCTLNIWSFGTKHRQHRVQINVNFVEMSD